MKAVYERFRFIEWDIILASIHSLFKGPIQRSSASYSSPTHIIIVKPKQHNLSPENIEVRDSVGTVAYLNSSQFFIIENGFANTSFSNADGSFYSPFVYKWNATLPDVYWTLNYTALLPTLRDGSTYFH
jgi:hypothetical protein